MLRIIVMLTLSLAWIAGDFQTQAQAQTAAEFYKGKKMSIITGSKPGAGTDLTARLFASHLSKDLGTTIVIVPKTGGAHMESYNYVWRAKPDGLTIGCESLTSIVSNDLMDEPAIQYEAEKYTYFASLLDVDIVFVVKPDGPIKSIQDLKAGKGLKIAATSPSGMRAINLMMIAHCLDLDAKIIAGFKGGKDAELAVMQGEAIGTSVPTVDYLSAVKGGTFRGLFMIGDSRSEALPEVPPITELVIFSKEKRELFDLIAGTRGGTAFYGPPGIPKDRVDFLRKNFNELKKRTAFRADLAKLLPWVEGGVELPIADGEAVREQVIRIKKDKKMWQEKVKFLFEKYR